MGKETTTGNYHLNWGDIDFRFLRPRRPRNLFQMIDELDEKLGYDAEPKAMHISIVRVKGESSGVMQLHRY